jgi:uncharacterized protein YbjT (DUF2867 family)
MSSVTQSRNIIIAGGSGKIGSKILAAIHSTGLHKVSVISRPDSTAEFPSGVAVLRGLYTDEAFLATALDKQDVLIVTLAKPMLPLQLDLIRAAAKAGVPYILPSEFGTDTSKPEILPELPFLEPKMAARKAIDDLGVSSWIAIINSNLINFSLRHKEWFIDIPNRKAAIWDDGNTKSPFSTLSFVGNCVARLLSLPESELARHKNQFVKMCTFYISQRDIIASAARVTGTKFEEWKIEHSKLNDALVAKKREFADGNFRAAEPILHMQAFNLPALDFHSVVNYEMLGVQPESLDDAMKELVKEYGY